MEYEFSDPNLSNKAENVSDTISEVASVFSRISKLTKVFNLTQEVTYNGGMPPNSTSVFDNITAKSNIVLNITSNLLNTRTESSMTSEVGLTSESWMDINVTDAPLFIPSIVTVPNLVYIPIPVDSDTYFSTTYTVSREALILKTVSLVLIAISGIFVNGFITYSVIRDRNLHKPPFYYLLSFCVSDLSRAIFCIPIVMTSVLQGSVWNYGSAACKLFAFANSFFVYSSCMVLLAIAIDRHLSLVHVKFYKKRFRGVVNLISVIIGWTIAFTMSFPPVLGVGSYVFIPEEGQCTFHHKYYKKNDTLAFKSVFTLIILLTLFLYARIFLFLRDHRRMRPLELQPARSSNWNFFGPGANGQAMINWVNGFGGPNPNPVINHNNQNIVRNNQRPNIGRVVNLQVIKNEHLTRLFFVVTIVFAVLWTPYTIVGFWRIFGHASSIPSHIVTVSAWMTYAQIALCPLVYVLCRGPIRKSSRTIYSNHDKKEFLLETRNRK